MKRSALILMLALAASATVFVGSYLIAQGICAKHLVNPADDLAWLRQEFRLTDAELGRVRTLHEGYLPKCAEMCERIAAKKQELEQYLAGQTDVSTTVEQKLSELGALRAQCQTEMLRHFFEVSQAMPPEPGRRYLAEMQRVTLGTHERIEQSMSDSAGHAHGHE